MKNSDGGQLELSLLCHGNDLEDWFGAESEILLPIAVKTYEFEDTFIIHAQVPVLTTDEIQVSVEQRRIVT